MISTVLGTIDEIDLGTTYIHEHLYVLPNELQKYKDYVLDDVEKIIEEVQLFKQAGGCSIVDLAPVNFGRNPQALKRIAEATGVNVLFVTGFHKEEFHPNWLSRLSDEEIQQFLLDEIQQGASSANLVPCAMKIGTSYNHMTPSEQRIIQIAGRVQANTGIPMITHCDKGTMGMEQLTILEENGADLSKVCLSHVDMTNDVAYIEQLCSRGAMVSFDHVGRDLKNKDAQKLKLLNQLIIDGFEEHICLSGDMGKQEYLKVFDGAPGLDYILTEFQKHFLLKNSKSVFKKLVNDNPQRLLTRQ